MSGTSEDRHGLGSPGAAPQPHPANTLFCRWERVEISAICAELTGATASRFRTRTIESCGTTAWRTQGQSLRSGIMEVMSKSSSRRFPVTVTHLPVTRCQICRRTVAYRPGSLSEVLTEHYRRAHPEALGLPSR